MNRIHDDAGKFDYKDPTLRGSNNPPTDANPLRERLLETAAGLVVRAGELLAAEARLPAITDDEASGKASDFVKMVHAAWKAADSDREREKEPYLAGGRTVDGFYKKEIIDPLDGLKRRVQGKITVYLRAKEAEERARREATEREARAVEAELRKAAEKRAAEMKTATDLDAAIIAEREAEAARAVLVAAEAAASAKAAEMSRTRGDLGALSSLRTFWTHDPASLDRAALDLESLRQHLPTAALEQAVRSFIKAGGRDLRGARIFEQTEAVTR